MSFHSFTAAYSTAFHRITSILVPLSVLLTTYLYLYPVVHGCVFSSTDDSFKTAFRDTLVQHIDTAHVNPIDVRPHLAPFRLLVLADPQLEGDSSLPKPEDALDNKVVKHWYRLVESRRNESMSLTSTVREVVVELFGKDIPGTLRAARKRLDLFGNDYYLAHIFRTLHWWTKPTHVTVLGDLVGSQWVDDAEFEWRGWRYWNRVFAGGRRVDDSFMGPEGRGAGLSVEMDNPDWRTRIINLAGNHDIGYAGDITQNRLDRFEKMYGSPNWDVRFSYPGSRMNVSADGRVPKLHLIVLNSMLLDTPALEEDLLTANYDRLNDLIMNRLSSVDDPLDFTLLLTHVPLHKKEGICIDGPMFNFWGDDGCPKGNCKPGGLREQNHLSEFASQTGVLQSIFGISGDIEKPAQGKGRPGLVLTGHDHEGCDTWHYVPANSTFKNSERREDEEEYKTVWDASRWERAEPKSSHTGVREVTLRSMMGEFGGNAGLLSAWFDFERGQWQYDIQMCSVGVQHIWWAIHIVDLLAVVALLLSTIIKVWGMFGNASAQSSSGVKSIKLE